METALAKTEPDYQGLQMVVSATEAQKRLQSLQAFVKTVMRQGEDFGTIPGTPKPTLFQPGAQKLAELYGLGWRFEDVETVQNWEQGFFFYRKKCIIFSRRDGNDIGHGLGSCNSREDRYAWRWCFESDIPAGMDKATLTTKSKTSKNGRPFKMYRLPNPDIYSVVNTIEKMAAKRAFVGAIISATRSAGLFTQDLEDLPREAFTTTGEPVDDDDEAPRGPDASAIVAGLVVDYSQCKIEESLRSLEEQRKGIWTKSNKEQKAQLKAASDAAKQRILDAMEPPRDDERSAIEGEDQ
jgi:hypothetical protein